MPQQNIAIQPSTILIQASQRTNGDGEFNGNGPIMYLTATLFRPTQYHVSLSAFARFQETRSDYTTYQGSFLAQVFDIRNQFNGQVITNILTPPFNTAQTLNGYGIHHFDFGDVSLVRSIDAIGDEYGGIFGGDDHPQVTLLFNNIVIETQAEA